MFIKNILYTLLIITLPHQTYSMKRVNSDSQEDISSNNALSLVSHENQLMADIKKNIFNFDPIALNAIISTEQASQLNAEQKNELHTTAKELKKQIAETQQQYVERFEEIKNRCSKFVIPNFNKAPLVKPNNTNNFNRPLNNNNGQPK